MDAKTAKTAYGAVEGSARRGAYVWRGIPYAKPPVGALRFAHAQPPEPWQGTLDAARFGSVCPQPRGGKRAAEDCLTLNVWAPIGAKPGRAVMFFIHGGSFENGAGSDPKYDGAKLARAGGVVVVTVNYRLGALGFLDFSHLDKAFRPNCGLSDIVMALRWVHGNIAAFGGDPGNITVFGQSAGATAASALSVMPEAKQFISKVILMSAGPVWMHTPGDARTIAARFLEFMGIETAERLRAIPAGELVKKQRKFIARSGFGESAFSIEVDGALVPEYPIPAAADGRAGGIPALIGVTREEMSFCAKGLLSKIMAVKDTVVALLLREKRELREKLLGAYEKYGAKAQTMLLTDHVFRLGSMWLAQARGKFAETWMYSFDYAPVAMKLTGLGACHSSDIPFLFGNFRRSAFIMTALSPVRTTINRVSAQMQRDFISFAKTGRLDWETCGADAAPAKHYDKKCGVAPVVEPKIAACYEKSLFKRNSHFGTVFG